MASTKPLFPLVWNTLEKTAQKNNLSSERISEAIKVILLMYTDLLSGAFNLPYGRSGFSCAYIYLYFTSHIRMVQHFFQKFWKLEDYHFMKWFEEIAARKDGKLDVCSVGGGPGSDIFGLYFFMKENSWPMQINGTILDQFEEWNEISSCFRTVLKKHKCSFAGSIKHQYYEFDIFDSFSQSEVGGADLVTMVKFMSAVDGCKYVEDFKEILCHMKPGSLLFFVDNSGGGYRQTLDEAAESLDFYNIKTIICELFTLKGVEIVEMKDNKLHCSPQTSTNVTASLWRKVECLSPYALSHCLAVSFPGHSEIPLSDFLTTRKNCKKKKKKSKNKNAFNNEKNRSATSISTAQIVESSAAVWEEFEATNKSAKFEKLSTSFDSWGSLGGSVKKDNSSLQPLVATKPRKSKNKSKSDGLYRNEAPNWGSTVQHSDLLKKEKNKYSLFHERYDSSSTATSRNNESLNVHKFSQKNEDHLLSHHLLNKNGCTTQKYISYSDPLKDSDKYQNRRDSRNDWKSGSSYFQTDLDILKNAGSLPEPNPLRVKREPNYSLNSLDNSDSEDAFDDFLTDPFLYSY